MVAASSNFFRANLGPLDDRLLQRVDEWSGQQFAAHSVCRSAAGDAVLLAPCPTTKTKKSFGMAIRTLFKNWKAPLDLPEDWLEPLSQTEYETGAGVIEHVAPLTPSPQHVRVEPAMLADGVILQMLSPGFDERAEQMWRQLQQKQISCAA